MQDHELFVAYMELLLGFDEARVSTGMQGWEDVALLVLQGRVPDAENASICSSQQFRGQQDGVRQPQHQSCAATCHEALGTPAPLGSMRPVLCSSQQNVALCDDI